VNTGAAAKPYSEALGGGAAGLKIAVVQEGFGHPQSLPQIDAIVHEAAGRFRPRKIQIPAQAACNFRNSGNSWATIL
jgi:amidase